MTAGSCNMFAWTNAGQALAAATKVSEVVWARCDPGVYVILQARTRINNTDATSNETADVNLVLRSDRWLPLVPPAYAVQAGKTGDRVVCSFRLTAPSGTNFYLKGMDMRSGSSYIPRLNIHTDGGDGRPHSRSGAGAQFVHQRHHGSRRLPFLPRLADTTTMPGAGTGTRQLLAWRNGGTHQLNVYFDEATKTWKTQRIGSGTSGIATSAATTHRVDEEITVAATWNSTTVKVSYNGAPFVSTAQSAIPTGLPALMDLGSPDGTTGHLDGRFLWAMFGGGLLTDADALAFHAIGRGGPTALDAERMTSSPTALLYFDDSGYHTAVTAIPCEGITVDTTDSYLANEARVTRPGGLTQTAVDAASQTKHGEIPLPDQDLIVSTDAEALTIATEKVTKYANSLTRITEVVLNGLDANALAQLETRNLGDRVTVVKTPHGGEQLTQFLLGSAADVGRP